MCVSIKMLWSKQIHIQMESGAASLNIHQTAILVCDSSDNSRFEPLSQALLLFFYSLVIPHNFIAFGVNYIQHNSCLEEKKVTIKKCAL